MKKTTTIILIVGVIVMLNVLAQEFFFRWDVTENDQYTLSQATLDILKDLEDPVTITAYFSENLPTQIGKTREDFQDLLVEYASRSKGMVQYEFISPNEDPQLEQQVMQSGIRPVMIQDREKDEMKQVKAYMGALIQAGEQEEAIPFIQPGAAMEYALTTGIKKISVLDKPEVGLIGGHGEAGFQELGQVVQALQVLYNVENIDMSTVEEIAPRFRAVAMIRPTDSIPPQHFEILDDYLDKGGKILVAADFVEGDFSTASGAEFSTGLSDWLAKYQINVEPAFVLDNRCGSVSVQQQQGFFRINTPVKFPYLPLINAFPEHPITQGLEEVLLEFASPVTYSGERKFDPLLITSKKAGSQSPPVRFDVQRNWSMADFPQSDITMGGVLHGEGGSGELVLFTDGNFPISGQQGTRKDNVSLLVNAVDWLSDDTGLIDLRTKGVATRPIEDLEDVQRMRMKWINFLLPIVLVIAYGLFRRQLNIRKRRRLMEESYV
ncbi:MAG: Gldg family protein [Saprospiraceae bacterium]|nr:Gldg family protein [Saprospiraceae bacterium]